MKFEMLEDTYMEIYIGNFEWPKLNSLSWWAKIGQKLGIQDLKNCAAEFNETWYECLVGLVEDIQQKKS